MEQIIQAAVVQEKLWTKKYTAIMLITFMAGISMTMLMPTLPLYAKHIGGSNTIAGLIIGIFTLSALLFRPLFGNLLDNYGRNSILIFGVILVSIITLSFNIAYTITILILLRCIHGVGFSAHTTACGAIVSDVVPHSRRGEGIGYFGVINTITAAFGPALGIYIYGHLGYNALFITSFLMALGSLVGALSISTKKRDMDKKLEESIGADPKSITNLLMNFKKSVKNMVVLEKTSIPAASVLFFVAFSYGGVISFLTSYAGSRGIKDISIFFIVYAFAVMLSRPMVGKLTDRYGFSVVILPGTVLLAISFILLSFAASLSDFLIVSVLYGIGYGSMQPTLNAIMFTLCPPERRGAASASFFSTMDSGVGLGAIVWGIVAQKAGLSSIYQASAGCIVVAYLAYIFVLRKQLMQSKR